jgi:hypothetical protein
MFSQKIHVIGEVLVYVATCGYFARKCSIISSELRELRAEMASMREELVSLKNRPPPPPDRGMQLFDLFNFGGSGGGGRQHAPNIDVVSSTSSSETDLDEELKCEIKEIEDSTKEPVVVSPPTPSVVVSPPTPPVVVQVPTPSVVVSEQVSGPTPPIVSDMNVLIEQERVRRMNMTGPIAIGQFA